MAMAITLAAGCLYYFTSVETFKASAGMAAATVTQLNRCYDLLEQIPGDMSNLQQLLRENDPDLIEKSSQNLAASQKKSAALIASCGSAAKAIRTHFDLLVTGENKVQARRRRIWEKPCIFHLLDLCQLRNLIPASRYLSDLV